MKFKNIAVLSLAISISIGAAAHAAVLPAADKPSVPEKKVEMKEDTHHMHKGHRGGIFQAAKEMGITDEEIIEAKKSGKTFFDLAKQKGYNEQQVRSMIIKNKTAAIDEKVKEGKISKDKADEIKKKITDRFSKWDGKFKEHKDMNKEHKEEKED